ncbi:HNH endonuclease [Roseibacillus ishigakijimensis]|uniref:HNH endonuclease n=1 Tax=Roseibacillus ishigakijimensis TaxID=454146 RepID=A0A934VMS0_9BACT|nr:HNH endonuclease [Roseibacillus ishigakijimensis]MBK1834391.1 HNH endonuclease [Roseibacillus ishigakijimensis]
MARWTREELLQALNLYHRTPFGRQHSRYRPIIQLADKLGRTPGSVAMKLNNFTSLDPLEKARGIKGLSGASQLDRAIWEEFENDLPALAEESEPLLDSAPEAGIKPMEPNGPTEKVTLSKSRRHQSFFRRTVLATYDYRCCLSGNPLPELLRASHIIPWSESKALRLKPTNGLCLAATYDAAFDRGLISFDENYRLLIGARLHQFAECEDVHRAFLDRAGSPLSLPEKNLPSQEALDWHRRHLFRS